LGGVTQVVAPDEGTYFHNRLTHSLKVAQLSQRIAQKLVRANPGAKRSDGEAAVDPDVAEAAALAHDLGHPPFGHVGEDELNRLVEEVGDPDGFEGNAQSFRTITRIEPHSERFSGLNLTRRTLNAVLKYPWLRSKKPEAYRDRNKFGAYESDVKAFEFARDGWERDVLSPEAQIMDLADSITYSVHDLDDCFRAQLIPLWRLARDGPYRRRLLDGWVQSDRAPDPEAVERLEEDRAFEHALVLIAAQAPYEGTQSQRALARTASSALISNSIGAIELVEEGRTWEVRIDAREDLLLRFLQRLVWVYVIDTSRMGPRQEGFRRVVRTLYQFFFDAIAKGDPGRKLLPAEFRELAGSAGAAGQARLAADIVASMSDPVALQRYREICGLRAGSVTDMQLLQ
jgi:dGTPase